MGVMCDTWSMCTIQVHSFRCYYYTSETLAKKSSKAQLSEAHRAPRTKRNSWGFKGEGFTKGENERGEKGYSFGEGLRTLRQWIKLRPKLLQIVQSERSDSRPGKSN